MVDFIEANFFNVQNWQITSWLLDRLAPGPWASTISTSSLWEMVETTNLRKNFSYMFDLLAAYLQYQLISRNKVELHWIKWTACEIKILGKNKNNRFQTFPTSFLRPLPWQGKGPGNKIETFPTTHNGWDVSSITSSHPSTTCIICCFSGQTKLFSGKAMNYDYRLI